MTKKELTFATVMMMVIAAISLVPHVIHAVPLPQGSDCIVSATNTSGKCIEFGRCKYAIKLLETKIFPQTCGFIERVPLVCCPKHEETKLLKAAPVNRPMCPKYWPRRRFLFISAGVQAAPRHFTHMAAIGYDDKKNGIVWLCGGSVISKYFILTAAHCLSSHDFGAPKLVRLGDLDLKNTTDDANPEDVVVDKVYSHPNYRYPSLYNDIALIKLKTEIKFKRHLKPACLHTEKHLPVDTLEATGWGRVGLFEESSSHLMKVDLKVVNHSACSTRYSDVSTRKLKDGILDHYQICAGSSFGGDTCPGDSGGPLHYKVVKGNTFHFAIAGITSFGNGCGGENSVGVYTRVSSYISWIAGIVWAEEEHD